MKKLQMIFKNGTGKKVTLTQRDCRDDLTAETVREVMAGVANLALIEKKGIAQYVEPVSAHYVETIKTDLF